MAEHIKEIFISYAWGGNSEEFVNRLDQAFQAKNITIIRDKRDLIYRGLIKEFMERIGRGKCVIAVINDEYLKSPNCMFELVQVSKNGDFYNRFFPIVLTDAQIYDPVQTLKYIKYWEEKKNELSEAMKEVGPEYLQGIREEIDQYTEIRNTIAKLTKILKNMNTLTADIHSQSDFEILLDAVNSRLVVRDVEKRIARFVCHSQQAMNAEEVYVAGTFNDWLNAREGKIEPHEFFRLDKVTKEEVVVWEKEMLIPIGPHDFKFVVGHNFWIHWYEQSGYPKGSDAPGGNNFRIDVA